MLKNLFSFQISLDWDHTGKHIDPQLHDRLTFDTLIEGECNRLARSVGKAVAFHPGSSPLNPLCIYGDSGVGKTHLLHAIGHEVQQLHPDLQVLCIPMQQLMEQVRAARKTWGAAAFTRFYRQIDVLLIDDMQVLNGHPEEQAAVFNLLENIVLSNKQLVLTASGKSLTELKEIAKQLLTHFRWGISVQLTPPDCGIRERIMQSEPSAGHPEKHGERH